MARAMRKPTILLLEQDEPLRQQVRTALANSGLNICNLHDQASVLPSLQQLSRALVIIGPSRDYTWDELSVAQKVRQVDATIPVILATRISSEDRAIKALKLHLDDYFKMPLSSEDLIQSISASIDKVPDHTPSPATMSMGQTKCIEGLIGDSAPMQLVKIFITKAAATDCNVLITGETGTGKERVAALIHHCSQRHTKPFICINCAALPDSLVEGELFGYERGAFTGAATRYEGKLRLADGGSVFFDEIGDMSAYAQAKILRAIETREVFRLGGRCSVPVDFRMIAATNHDLEGLIEEGKFRKDLYYRLNVVRIELPPLRLRKDDIPVLLDHYLRECNRRYNRNVDGFADEVAQLLLEYAWPGNIRELKNLLEATFINGSGCRIRLIDLPDTFRRRYEAFDKLPAGDRELLLQALLSTNWNKSKAAQKLHWSRMTVYRKMVKYSLTRQKPNPPVTL
jgi:DNA-binding NtrC family response regulator